MTKETLEQRQRLYDTIKCVEDLPTRNLLYIQFIDKYYPEALKAISEEFWGA